MSLPIRVLAGLATMGAGYALKRAADNKLLDIKVIVVQKHNDNVTCVYKDAFNRTQSAYCIGNQWYDNNTNQLLGSALTSKLSNVSQAWLKTRTVPTTPLIGKSDPWE